MINSTLNILIYVLSRLCYLIPLLVHSVYIINLMNLFNGYLDLYINLIIINKIIINKVWPLVVIVSSVMFLLTFPNLLLTSTILTFILYINFIMLFFISYLIILLYIYYFPLLSFTLLFLYILIFLNNNNSLNTNNNNMNNIRYHNELPIININLSNFYHKKGFYNNSRYNNNRIVYTGYIQSILNKDTNIKYYNILLNIYNIIPLLPVSGYFSSDIILHNNMIFGFYLENRNNIITINDIHFFDINSFAHYYSYSPLYLDSNLLLPINNVNISNFYHKMINTSNKSS